MKFKISLLMVLFSFLVVSGCNDSDSSGLSEATKTLIDDTVKCTMLQDQLVGMGVVVTKNGVPIYQEQLGYADASNKIPVTAETSFPIGSVTKTFTTIALLQLVEDGFASLDDAIGLYLPELLTNDEWKEVTIRELLSMTSGLPQNMVCLAGSKEGETCAPPSPRHPLGSEFNCGVGMEVKDIPCVGPAGQIPFIDNLVDAEKIMPTISEAGSTYSYINMNFVLAGLVLESISGLPFEDYLKNNVLDPIGMTKTAPSKLPLSDTPNSSLGYRMLEQGEDPVSEPFPCVTIDDVPEGCGPLPLVAMCEEIPTDKLTAPFESYTAGYLTTTQNDMIKYEKALNSMDPVLLDKESFDVMWTNDRLTAGPDEGQYVVFGLGWVICSELDPSTCPSGVDPATGGDTNPPARLTPVGEVGKVVQKDGGVNGFGAQIDRYLDDGVTVYVNVNTAGTNFSIVDFTRQIAQIVRNSE